MEGISPLLIKRRSQMKIRGTLRVVLLFAGELPTQENKNSGQTVELRLTNDYLATFHYFPHGLDDKKFTSLSVGVQAKDGSSVSMKFKGSVITSDGRCWYDYCSVTFFTLPSDVFFRLTRFAPINEIHEKIYYFTTDSMLNFQVTLLIDSNENRENIPSAAIPTSAAVIQRIKEKIHNPWFGNTEFIIGGINMYGHHKVLIRYQDLFKKNFGQSELKRRYILPDCNPHLFEKLLIDCYLKELRFCEKCCLGL